MDIVIMVIWVFETIESTYLNIITKKKEIQNDWRFVVGYVIVSSICLVE